MKVRARAEDDAGQATSEGGKQNRIVIQKIEKDRSKKSGKPVAWLGVATDETSETLTSQLGLPAGEGLVVSYVVPDSPAAKEGLKKNDVLVTFDEQLLVHPAQLRKLVQMHKEGDTIKLGVYRGGKKQEVRVTLGQTVLHDAALDNDLQDLKVQLQAIPRGMHDQMAALHESLMRGGIDRQKLNEEVERNIELARKAIRDALRNTTNHHRMFGSASKDLEDLARDGMEVDKGATVVVKNVSKSVKSAVKTDDSGTYVIVATPKKSLNVHDNNGKLVFDGPIESAEEQAKVPKEIWEKVKPMLEEMGSSPADEPETNMKEDEESSLQGCRDLAAQSQA
jgi:hypothetical protein